MNNELDDGNYCNFNVVKVVGQIATIVSTRYRGWSRCLLDINLIDNLVDVKLHKLTSKWYRRYSMLA